MNNCMCGICDLINNCGLEGKWENCNINNLLVTIESQQQEITKLNDNLAGMGQICADYDTALQEIEQLKQGISPQLEEALTDKKYYRNMVEQLQAQNGAMREALEFIVAEQAVNEEIDEDDLIARYLQEDRTTMYYVAKALMLDAGKDYHNPADVEALAKAREAINKLLQMSNGWDYGNNYNFCFQDCMDIQKEAITAMDKAVGE